MFCPVQEMRRSRIRSASLEPDIEKFLLCAAERHTVFNFSRIADYYAHAPAEIQCFFEESALVIIDYQQAIENGFVRMTQRMVEIMHGGEEENMRDDFCAFILTHGRPDKVLTYRTLRRAGYTGKIFIVVDDEDKTRHQYMAEFGEQVLVFSKVRLTSLPSM